MNISDECSTKLDALSPEQDAEVTHLWKSKDTRVVIDKFNIEISGVDIKRLRPTTWLNDELINFYMEMINARSRDRGYYCFNSFMMVRMLNDEYMARWVKKVGINIFEMKQILFPTHVGGNHWVLAVINFEQQRLELFDSLGGEYPNVITAMEKFTFREAKRLDQPPLTWTRKAHKRIPHQNNGSDCGVFVCVYADYITTPCKFNFSNKDMLHFRKRITLQIKNGSLVFPTPRPVPRPPVTLAEKEKEGEDGDDDDDKEKDPEGEDDEGYDADEENDNDKETEKKESIASLNRLAAYENNETQQLRADSSQHQLPVRFCAGTLGWNVSLASSDISPLACVGRGTLENILRVVAKNDTIKPVFLPHRLSKPPPSDDTPWINASVQEADQFPQTLLGLDFLNAHNYQLNAQARNVAASILHRPPLQNTRPFETSFLHESTRLDCGALALATHILPSFATMGVVLARNNTLLPGIVYAHSLEQLRSVVILNRRDWGEWELVLDTNQTFVFELRNGKIMFPTEILANWIASQLSQKEILQTAIPLSRLVPGFKTGSWMSASEGIPRAKPLAKARSKDERLAFYSSQASVGGFMIQDALWGGPAFNLNADLLDLALPIPPRLAQDEYAALESTYRPTYLVCLQQILSHLGIDIVPGSNESDPTIHTRRRLPALELVAPFVEHILQSMYLFLYPQQPALFDLTATFLLKTYLPTGDPDNELPVLKTVFARLSKPYGDQDHESRVRSRTGFFRDFIQTFERITPEFNSYRLTYLAATQYACLPTTTNFELTAKIMMLFLIQVVRPFMNWTQTYYLADLYVPWLIPESLFEEKYKFLGEQQRANEYRTPQFLDSIFSTKPTKDQLQSPIWILPLTIRQNYKYFQRILLVFHHRENGPGWIEFFDTCNTSEVRKYVITALQTAVARQHPAYAKYGYKLKDYEFFPMIRPDSYLTRKGCYLSGNVAKKNKDCLQQTYLFAVLSIQNQSPRKLITYVNYSPVAYSKTSREIERELFAYASHFLKLYQKKMTTFVLTHFRQALVSLAKEIRLRRIPDAELLQYLNVE